MTILNLKKIRERINAASDKPAGQGIPAKQISQADLSAMLSAHGITISQTQISRYEDQPGGVPISVLEPWLLCLGTSIAAESKAAQKADASVPVNPGAPLDKLRARMDMLEDYATTAPQGLASDELAEQGFDIGRLTGSVRKLRRKPTLVVVGLYDAGKTTFVNTLTTNGADLPEDYSPTTRAVSYLHHTEERPDWIKERVWLMREGWSHLNWRDEAHTREHLVVAGDLDTLRSYAIHDGEHADAGAQFALVFLSADVLKAVTIIDHPGFGNTDEDSKLAESSTSEMDAIAYLSNSTGFMRMEEIERLRYMLRKLPTYETLGTNFPTLGNLFVIATHAFPQISDEKLKTSILEKNVRRMMTHLGPHEFEERQKQAGRVIDETVLGSRVFSFCREVPDRCSRLFSALEQALAVDFRKVWEVMADREIHSLKQTAMHLTKYIAQIEHFLKSREDALSLDERLHINESERKEKLAKQVNRVHALISELSVQHKREFTEFYDRTITPDEVEKVIRTKFPEKKEAQQEIANYIKGVVEHRMRETAQTHSQTLKVEIDRFTEFLDEELKMGAGPDVGVEIPFDSKGAFMSGLVTAGALGALSIWAASFGSLGGYAVAATVLGWFGVGGAAWMSGIAAIGGPITIALGVAVGIFFAVKALFGDSWQTRLAKSACETLTSKHGLRDALCKEVQSFWSATRTAFDAGVAKYEEEHAKYLGDVREMAHDDAGIERARARLNLYEEAKRFFVGIPWVSLAT